MEDSKILITDLDRQRLLYLLAGQLKNDIELQENFKILKVKLESARVVNSKEVPPNVVTMNSMVMVKNISFGTSNRFTLVYPVERNALDRKISVLSPLGATILGFAQGDLIEWEDKRTSAKFLIEKIIYQPEAAGDYDL